MNLKHSAWLLIVGAVVYCGNTNDIKILAPGIVSREVKVVSLQTSKVIAKKNIKDGQTQFGATELGLGLQPLEIQIHKAVYEDIKNNKTVFSDQDYLSAVVDTDVSVLKININALTTLASCRFKKMISEVTDPNINEIVKTQNSLIASQFKILDLQEVEPNIDFSSIREMNDSSVYGILLGGFEQLAEDQNLTVPELVTILCRDVDFDEIFNGIDKDGVIQNKRPLFDEQVLKAKYAEALFNFAQNSIDSFVSLPIDALSNDISLSATPALFSPSIVNYSFDH